MEGGRMLLGSLAKSVGVLLATVAALVVFTYWPEYGQVFGRTPAEVRGALAGLDLPPHVFGSVPKKVKVLTPSLGTMVWSISEDESEEMMRYVVTLTAQGAGATRVKVDVTGRTGTPIADVASYSVRTRAVRNIYVIAMKEQIAAALEQRDFQTAKIMLPTAIAVLVNMTYISAWLEDAGNSPPRRG
jgi:hypothetical protein